MGIEVDQVDDRQLGPEDSEVRVREQSNSHREVPEHMQTLYEAVKGSCHTANPI